MSTLDIVAGIGCAAGAAACFDGAVAWQAMEARRVVSGDRRLLARLVRRPRWLAATGLSALGWPLQLAALSLAPLTVVQPTLAAGLLVLLALGVIVLGEHVGVTEIAGAAAIEIVVPVALAPLVAGESWSGTPGGGAAILAGLLIVTAGMLPLASAPAIRALEQRPATR